jgi:hypothetical protein
MFLGTPAYASPEQLLGSDIDRRTDIFSFGVILYELAAGQHPFGKVDSMAMIARILEGETKDLIQINPKTPKELDRIIRRCLKKNQNDRYNSTRDLLVDLEQVADATKQGAPSTISGAAVQPKTGPLWWWQFHQAVAGFGYYAMLYPLWRVKGWLGGVEGSLYFFPALVAVGVAANLRLHLWFTSRFYMSELAEPAKARSVRCDHAARFDARDHRHPFTPFTPLSPPC